MLFRWWLVVFDLVVAVGICAVWMRCETEMLMLEHKTSNLRERRTMAIYVGGGQWKIEGSLQMWLVRCLDLVSEDSQHGEQRRAINMLLTRTVVSSILYRTTNHGIWRENEMQ